MFAYVGFILLFATATTAAPTDCQFSLDLANKTRPPLSQFSIKLHKKITELNPDGNVVFSPVSIALALALVEAGAATQTQTELKQVLAPTGYNGDVSTLYQSLQHELRIQGENAKLSVANALFYHKAFTLKPEYLSKVKKCFETAIDQVDFQQSEAARQKINTWVSDATVQKIPELIKPNVLTADTKAVLANAIYLKAAWEERFELLEDIKFYELGQTNKAKTVKFMSHTGSYMYAGNDDFEIVEIPYKEAPISMFIIKAKGSANVATVIPKFATTPPLKLWESAQYRKIALKLPKFTIRLPTDLTTILGQLGLSSMFSDAGADFSRMDASNSIRVSSVVHEAYIKVNENGTEAAAATAVIMTKTFSGRIPWPEEPIPFTADYPFVFSIVHRPTDAFLFSGRVNTIQQDDA